VRPFEVEIEASVTEYLVAHIAIVGMQRAQVSPAIRTLFGGREMANEPFDLFEDDTADIRLCSFADQDFLAGRNSKSGSTLVFSSLSCCPKSVYGILGARLIPDSW
jgi:hypothetical protein